MRRIHSVSSLLAALAITSSTSAAFAQASAVVISELRTSTPRGGFKDELIELHNVTCSPVDVSGLTVRYATCSSVDPKDSVAVAVLPANTVIQPNGFYLLANTGYHGQTFPDQPFGATFDELSDSDGGIALVDAGGKVLDAVGFCDVVKFPSFPFREGTPLTPAAAEGDWTFLRLTPYGEASSYCEPETDTDNNAKDFFFNTSPSPQGLNDSECTYRPAPCETNVGKADKLTGFCSFPPKAVGLTCEDGNGCTVHDTCDGKGNCQSGDECPDPQPYCDFQGNSVQPQSFCTYPNEGPGVCIEGNPDGGEPITVICEFGCQAGVCDPDPCDPDACAAEAAPPCYVQGSGVCAQGICRFLPDFEATFCDDGNACTTNEVCILDEETSSLYCEGAPTPIDDGDACTLDSCNVSTGPVHLPVANGTSCNDDQNACNGVSACQDGSCVEVTKTVDCTTQAHACDVVADGKCDVLSGLCSFPTQPEGTACSDASACTSDDKCDALGRCAGVDVSCQGKAPTCADEKTQISYAGVCAGGECGFAETSITCVLGCDLATGMCVGAPCGGPCAPSDNPCALNQCDVATDKCIEIPRPNGKCDDGDACTVDDACAKDGEGAIRCLGSAVVCDNPPPSTCRADGKTSVTFAPPGICSAATSGCKYDEVEVVCADGCDPATGRCVVATGGAGGTSGQGGAAGSSAGAAGQGGSSAGAGQGGTAGQGGASGTAGKGGSAGTAGKGGTAGQGGKAGAGGAAGKAGAGGKAGSAGKAGAAGTAGKSGAAGSVAQGGSSSQAGTGGSPAQGGSSLEGGAARAGASGSGFGTSQAADVGSLDFDGGGLDCSVSDAGTNDRISARSSAFALVALAFAALRRRRRISPLRAERKKGTEHAMSSVDSSLLDKVLRSLRAPHTSEPQRSAGDLLTASAAAYGARPSDEEHTAPTGFDPMAAVLFEAIVESAFLVANADNEFDERERAVLVAVVEGASAGSVSGRQVEALLADLAEQLAEDGAEARIDWVARMVRKPEQKADVLRIAAVLAHASAGVSDVERDTLLKLGQAMGIQGEAVDQALADAATALA